jgi:Tol biopolymer transport system component
VSADGRRVAFHSTSATLVADDTNHTSDVFVIDVSTGAVRRVSVSSTGEQGNNQSGYYPAITADGRSVFFSTMATNLASGATSKSDILVRRLPD